MAAAPVSGKFDAVVAVAGREHVIANNPKKPTMRPVLLATGSKKNVIIPSLGPTEDFFIMSYPTLVAAEYLQETPMDSSNKYPCA
jgi:hypothetical protein